jgi:hypothetical protein
VGGILHLKLNIDTRPIANKYREGKVKRTLKRELKVRETVEREANKCSVSYGDCFIPHSLKAAVGQRKRPSVV